MAKIMVLGCGLVGKHIVTDLAKNIKNEIIAIDNFGKPELFNGYSNIHFEGATVNPSVVGSLLRDYRPEIVINALPGKIGFIVLAALIKDENNPECIVDISFMPENPIVPELQKLAKEKQMIVVTDFGIAPGISHAVLAFEKSLYPDLDHYECSVGGNPSNIESNIWRYKAPFSPRDVIEEYTRPARFIGGGESKVEDSPLYCTMGINIPCCPCEGRFIQFLSDGLRSLITSYPEMVDMSEWTIRHEKHIEQMQWLYERGFFDKDVIEYTAKTLINAWTLHEDEKDWLYMNIHMTNGGAPATTPFKKIIYEFYDEYTDGVPAMARTTGYACNAVVELLGFHGLRGVLQTGIFAPEGFIQQKPDLLNDILRYMGDRGIKYRRTSRIGDVKSALERGSWE